jgi:hypothetical protein
MRQGQVTQILRTLEQQVEGEIDQAFGLPSEMAACNAPKSGM